MDPNETLRLIEEALKSHRYLDASLSRMDLCTWIKNGGFEPDWDTYLRASMYVHRVFPLNR